MRRFLKFHFMAPTVLLFVILVVCENAFAQSTEDDYCYKDSRPKGNSAINPLPSLPRFLTLPFRSQSPAIKIAHGWYYEKNFGGSEQFGIDYATDNWASFDVIAAADGEACYYPKDNGLHDGTLGNFVRVRHNVDGQIYYTIYAHLLDDSSKIVSDKWTPVSRGQQLGIAGTTGASSGIHLHFELSKGAWGRTCSCKIDPYGIKSSKIDYPQPGDTKTLNDNNAFQNNRAEYSSAQVLDNSAGQTSPAPKQDRPWWHPLSIWDGIVRGVQSVFRPAPTPTSPSVHSGSDTKPPVIGGATIVAATVTQSQSRRPSDPCPSGVGPGGISAGSYAPQSLTQEQRQWLYEKFGHTGIAAVGYGGEECGGSTPIPQPQSRRPSDPCPSGVGPGGIRAGSYAPQALTQEQRQWLYEKFGHTGIAAVGYGGEECGVMAQQVPPTPTQMIMPTPIRPTIPPPIATPQYQDDGKTNWVIPYAYFFPSGFWTIGTHTYRQEFSCSASNQDISKGWKSPSFTFEVSNTAELLNGEVYFSVAGVSHYSTSGQYRRVQKIHPSQPTYARFGLVNLTRLHAERIVQGACNMIISWDGQQSQIMNAGKPRQE